MLGPNSFAVPAGTFGIYFLEQLFVRLASPLKATRQCIFIHLVVMIDVLLAFDERVVEVGLG